jgi:hypothetical protein
MAAILVTQRADDLVVDVGDGERGLEGRAGRHGAGRRRSSCSGRRGGDSSTQQASKQAVAEVKRTVEPHTDRHASSKQASKQAP